MSASRVIRAVALRGAYAGPASHAPMRHGAAARQWLRATRDASAQAACSWQVLALRRPAPTARLFSAASPATADASNTGDSTSGVAPPPQPQRRSRTILRGSAGATAATPTFASIGVPSHMLGKLARVGFKEPSAVQIAAVPPIMRGEARDRLEDGRPRPLRRGEHMPAGEDVVLHAETGSGKTLVYLLPLMASLQAEGPSHSSQVRGIIVVPTRELAVQVQREAEKLAQRGAKRAKQKGQAPIVVRRLVGQVDDRMLASLKRDPPHVVVATPQTLCDLIPDRMQLGALRYLICDEVDFLLSVATKPATEYVLAAAARLTHKPRMMLVSATPSHDVMEAQKAYLRKPRLIDLTHGSSAMPDTITHYIVECVRDNQKHNMVTRTLSSLKPLGTLAFLASGANAENLSEFLASRNVPAATLVNATQNKARAKALEQLAAGRLQVLMSTEMASRGLDLPRVSHVINVDVPASARAYVHRAGRVGRMGRPGTVVTLATRDEMADARRVAKAAGADVKMLRFEHGEPVVEG